MRGAAGDYWMAFFGLRTQLTEFVLREREFCEAMMKTVPPELWIGPTLDGRFNYREPTQIGRIKKLGIQKPWAPARSYGLVARLNGDGEAVESLHSRVDGRIHGVTGVCVVGLGAVIAASKGRNCLVELPSPRERREARMIAMQAQQRRRSAAASDRQGQQDLRRPARHRRRRFRAARRRDPRAARRERRRQVDALQGDRRRDHADLGRLSHQRREGRVRVARGGAAKAASPWSIRNRAWCRR